MPHPIARHRVAPDAVEDILLRVDRAVEALLGVVDEVVTSSAKRHSLLPMFETLNTNVRSTERAMRDLRKYSFPSDSLAIELSQHLTVVVLVADMVVGGHLSPTTLGDEDLFRRNVIGAQSCVRGLRAPRVHGAA